MLSSPLRISRRLESSGNLMILMVITMVALMITGVVSITDGMETQYILGEALTRGTQVLLTISVPSKVACAGACQVLTECLGFNWKLSASSKCELLSSLKRVVSDSSCNLYVPDVFQISALPLEYGCPTCMGSVPTGTSYWEHKCGLHGIAVGLASGDTFTDADFLLCANPPGLTLDFQNAATCDIDRDCKFLAENGDPAWGNTVVNSIWCNDRYYRSPSEFRSACRGITSSHKVDFTRCVEGQETRGRIPGVATEQKILQCPPHMTASRLYMDANTPAEVECCLLYIPGEGDDDDDGDGDGDDDDDDDDDDDEEEDD